MSKTQIISSILLHTIFIGQAQNNPLFDKLQFGDHDVGYRLLKAMDRARSPLKEQYNLPKEQQFGRTVPIYFWYPAQDDTKEKLSFGAYMNQWAYAWDYEISQENITKEAKHQFSEYYWDYSDKLIDQYFDLQIITKAMEEATPAQGKFPLVVFSHGHLDRWWIWGEFLASHGIAVIGTPNAGTFQKRHEIGLAGLETQIRDAEFAISVVSQLNFIDHKKVLSAGSSYGSLSATGLASRNKNVKGVISLDGIIADWNEGELLQRTPYWDYQQFNTPILHTHSAARYSSNYIWMDQMKYADQYRIQFTQLRHEDYHFQGMTDLFGLSLSNGELSDHSTSFELLTQIVLKFIQGLTSHPDHLKYLTDLPAKNGITESLVKVEFKKAIPAVPSSSELVELVRNEGFDTLKQVYLQSKTHNQQPFSPVTFYDVGVMMHRLDLIEEEKTWFQYYLDCYPKSAEAMFRLARLETITGNEDEGRTNLKTAYELIDEDPHVTQGRRSYLKSRIEGLMSE